MGASTTPASEVNLRVPQPFLHSVRSIARTVTSATLALISSLGAPSARAVEPPNRAARPAESAPVRAEGSAASLPSALVFDSKGPTDADPAGKARGRALYEQGAQAYAEGRFLRAVELFQDAHRAYPTAQLLFNVGKAYDRAGSTSSALSYYRDYLRQKPDEADKAEVSARIAELEALLAARGVQQLSVLSEPALATVVLDGTAVGVTPWTGETWPGKHRITIERDGSKPSESVIEVAAHRADDFRFTLEAAPKPQSLPREAPRRASPAPSAPSPLTWAVLGAGTAALGAALFVEMANQNSGGISRTSAFFGGAGLSACAVGGVLLYVDFKALPDPSPARVGGVATTLSARF